MDDDNLVIISWQDFESSSPEIIRNLWKDENFSDVTLATDDGQIVRAHRVVLCSASSKLKMLLMVHKQDNPIVYLPGFDSGHLVNLVQFIYQGKCQVKAELLEEFLNCGKSLGVANLAEYFQAKGNDAAYEKIIQHQTTNSSREGVGFLIESVKNETPSEFSDQAGVRSDLCKICNRNFTHLNRHIKTKHSKREKKTCTACDMKFAQNVSLRRHFETRHSGKEKKKCNMCKYEAHKRSNITEHIERVHEGKIHKCKDCSFQAKTRDYMTHHIKSVHDGVTTMKCNQCEFECEYKVNSATKMLLHKETMHGEMSYKCDHCNYESKSKQHFVRHKQINHTRPKIVCGHCSFTTKQVWFLKNHVKSAHEGFRWSCDACDGKFKSPALLSLHRGKEHEKKLYTRSCTICNFIVETKDSQSSRIKINNHMDMIHRENNYTCEECSFQQKSPTK